ncbi:peptide-methionine (S)-S-oxide reductase MsrA [Croceibacterium ferulae]|uniref:peptide-methionine (S)-S-oxide reductase MsrA n=1 Tax=Croceibacterium ferulae TaxID=1854641 RepID=UPI000EADF0CC|nr:peptide-methionine (S)-S-oxide reductase MsrA [Croceibacterium ferulae]
MTLSRRLPVRLAPLLAAAALAACAPAAAADATFEAPVAARPADEQGGLKTAYFAGGCFWGVEAVFSHVKGVTSAVSGYHGGNAATASYYRVSSGLSGHAETVRVTYDPAQIRYDQLLRIFFSVVADPTLRDRQGPDRGSQYRAALIPVSAEQREVAAAYLAQMRQSGVWSRPIVTAIEPARQFFEAEAEHQDFARRNPQHGYIQRWDAPKVAALRRMFPDHYRATFRSG